MMTGMGRRMTFSPPGTAAPFLQAVNIFAKTMPTLALTRGKLDVSPAGRSLCHSIREVVIASVVKSERQAEEFALPASGVSSDARPRLTLLQSGLGRYR